MWACVAWRCFLAHLAIDLRCTVASSFCPLFLCFTLCSCPCVGGAKREKKSSDTPVTSAVLAKPISVSTAPACLCSPRRTHTHTHTDFLPSYSQRPRIVRFAETAYSVHVCRRHISECAARPGVSEGRGTVKDRAEVGDVAWMGICCVCVCVCACACVCVCVRSVGVDLPFPKSSTPHLPLSCLSFPQEAERISTTPRFGCADVQRTRCDILGITRVLPHFPSLWPLCCTPVTLCCTAGTYLFIKSYTLTAFPSLSLGTSSWLHPRISAQLSTLSGQVTQVHAHTHTHTHTHSFPTSVQASVIVLSTGAGTTVFSSEKERDDSSHARGSRIGDRERFITVALAALSAHSHICIDVCTHTLSDRQGETVGMRSAKMLHAARRCTQHTQLSVINAYLMPHRCYASTSASPPLSASAVDVPTLHGSVASAHTHVSFLLAHLLSEKMPSSLEAFVSLAEEWWGLVERLVQLPVVATDMGQLLMETAHAEEVQGNHGSSELEEKAIEQWEEWVWSSVPRTVPAPAAREAVVRNDALPVAPPDILSFTQFADLLYSYDRYRLGVRWGASRHSGDWASNGGASAAAAYYRRRYFLHPWHGMHCPAGTALQMPYVHVLQWMLAQRGSRAEASPTATELWERHRALEPFQPSSSSFKALDVCCQSGYVLDLLIRAGAGVVVAADADPVALANAESTYHECMREGVGRNRNAVLYTRRCDGLPRPIVTRADLSSSNGSTSSAPQKGGAGTHAGAEVESTSASAAERRRRRAREEGRGYSGLAWPSEKRLLSGVESGEADAATGPFDVLYIHPPSAASVWPVETTERFNLRKTMWWRRLNESAEAEGLDTTLLLPYLPCTVAPALARHNPLATRSGLEQALDTLRADAMERSVATSPYDGEALRNSALLTNEGYVVLVLPRTYEADLLLRPDMLEGPSLADWVVAQLDGYYDLVLRRRCGTHASSLPNNPEHWPNGVNSMLLGIFRDVQQRVEGASTAASTQWGVELQRISREEMWNDVLVLRKNKRMARRFAARRTEGLKHGKVPTAGAVQWEDSFEYNEYYPRGAVPHTSHHWTALVPTYSGLEQDFYESPSAVRNFLAVGHPVSTHSAVPADYGVPGDVTAKSAAAPGHNQAMDGVTEASQLASANFHTVFAQELRTGRRSKLRKLALSPLERQEWYIDEKLVKSSAANLALLNELSKWDLKDYDN
ncbi:hypothetical protein, conserved [Leishmania tarentolae]|uniref:Methyltransferase domain-containing protein n=1 Tax=Leishmania tarentolae TaxID=5689 RepID=A0A640KX16_LEITA|nr:hypothetical protein, conserved [Leishmania tarentolae]